MFDLPTAPPAQYGVQPSAITRAIDALEREELDPHGLVLARRGHVLLRCSWRPYRTDQPALVYSVSKTVLALAIGFLVAEGRVDVRQLVDAYVDLPNPAGLTVEHLLTMNTGHSRKQTLALPHDGYALLATPPDYQPGTHFAYNSPASLVMSQIVTAVTGERLTAYLRPRLFDRLGIGERWWMPHGPIDQGYSGLHLSADDLLRVAVMLTDGGRFCGRRVVERSWVDEMAKVRSDNSHHDPGSPDYSCGYGYQVWRSRQGFRADGSFGQFAIAVPEKGLAIAYEGASERQQGALDVLMKLVESVVERPVAADVAATTALASRLDKLDAWSSDGADSPVDQAQGSSPGLAGERWLMGRDQNGWTIDSGRFTIPVGDGAWVTSRRETVDHSGLFWLFSTRGSVTVGGTVRVDVRIMTAPHRITAAGTVGKPLTLTWHPTPLWHCGLDDLAVPVEVIMSGPEAENSKSGV